MFAKFYFWICDLLVIHTVEHCYNQVRLSNFFVHYSVKIWFGLVWFTKTNVDRCYFKRLSYMCLISLSTVISVTVLYIVAVSFITRGNHTLRTPQTCCKLLTNFIKLYFKAHLYPDGNQTWIFRSDSHWFHK